MSAPRPRGAALIRQRVLAQAFAPILQVPLNKVPDIAGLLVGPLAQGTTLTVR